MLGVAVFCWGLHSKLSLYQSAAAQRGVPVAKILSQKERAVENAPMERLLAGGSVVTFTHEGGNAGASALLLPANLPLISKMSGEILGPATAPEVLLLRRAQSGPRAPPFTT